MREPTPTDLNFVLETVNGVVAILTFFLLIFLTMYLFSELRRRHLAWRALMMSLPIGMSLALALYVEKVGALLTRVVVWVWRRLGAGGAGGPMSHVQLQAMLLGAVLMAIGLLMLIRVLSKPRFGNWPWIVSGCITVGYVAVSVMFR